ncbi:ATP-dependent DNA ligase [Saccharopolyspora rhizosphaerae]|uniref:ATP-dependent DNA ligase n=1 Tax=Saccharopolyspora rhizosphaerae TaxID=2492662 RepID=UPI00131568B3|nr:ATP-dependent DNA ligase [Saccharopolyspora rhizosphaerae]
MTVLRPPVTVTVAGSTRDLPVDPGRWAYEPKLDGYRVVGFAARRLLQTRQGNTALTSRFPEVVADLATLGDVVVDGELVAWRHGRLDFSALQAGPARRERDRITAVLMAFDLLAADERDLRGKPHLERRGVLEDLLTRPLPHVQLVEQTLDPQAAREWLSLDWGVTGVEGVMAKPVTSRYAPGQRSGWLKVRTTRTVEAVVLGVTSPDALVLGSPDLSRGWWVTGLSLPVPPGLRAELAARLRLDEARLDPVHLPGTVGGFSGDETVYQAVHPDTVVEVEADTAAEHGRFRHRLRVVRIRADLTPADLPPAHTPGRR